MYTNIIVYKRFHLYLIKYILCVCLFVFSLHMLIYLKVFNLCGYIGSRLVSLVIIVGSFEGVLREIKYWGTQLIKFVCLIKIV